MSPQCELVSYLCQSLGYKCHLFVPQGLSTSVLEYYKRYDVEVVGVRVGKDPKKNIEKYLNAPNIKYNIITYDGDYEKPAKQTNLFGVELDPIYEAKCIPELINSMGNVNTVYNNACIWVVGKRL